jgi:hypothetical protein
MKRVVKRVWAFAAVARPRTVARSFMLDSSKENRFDKHKWRRAESQFCYKTARVEVVDWCREKGAYMLEEAVRNVFQSMKEWISEKKRKSHSITRKHRGEEEWRWREKKGKHHELVAMPHIYCNSSAHDQGWP